MEEKEKKVLYVGGTVLPRIYINQTTFIKGLIYCVLDTVLAFLFCFIFGIGLIYVLILLQREGVLWDIK